jgi:nucleolar protein 4
VHNLPLTCDEKQLKKLVQDAGKKVTGAKISVLQCKVVRANDRVGADGKPRSRGFGFLQFDEHADALAVLRSLNNNAGPFGPEKRPIVMFAWEDAQAIRKLTRRREQMTQRDARDAAKKPERQVKTFTQSGGAKRSADTDGDASEPAAKKRKQRVRSWMKDGADKPKPEVKVPANQPTVGNRKGFVVAKGKGAKAAAAAAATKSKPAEKEKTNQNQFQKKQQAMKRDVAKSQPAASKAASGTARTVAAVQAATGRGEDPDAKRARRAPKVNEGAKFDEMVQKYMKKAEGSTRSSWFD